MKNQFFLFFLFVFSFSRTSLAQKDVKLLVISCNEQNISLNTTIKKALNYNHVAIDSAKKEIKQVINHQLITVFKDYQISYFESKELLDSVNFSKKFQSDHLEKIQKSSGATKVFLMHEDREDVYYMGTEMNATFKDVLKENSFDFLIIITRLYG